MLLESILVEVSADKTVDLGVNWAIDGSADSNAVGGFIQPIGGTSIVDVARLINDPSTATSAPSGLTLGVGRIMDTGTNFAAILRALRTDADNNIIATPQIVTMDNQEAEIKVAQEVPFLTGQYANTGSQVPGVNPFQTIQREEVGNILKITPSIASEGDLVILKIQQEASNVAANTFNAVDIVTNKRTITTNVLIEDGGIIVLGGLISDQVTGSEQRVPILGRIPLIGELFRVRNTQRHKSNLMFFIRPKILRDGVQTAVETNTKYNNLRDQQLKLHGGKAPLLPFEKQPVLTPPPAPAATPPTTPPAGTGAPTKQSPDQEAQGATTTPLDSAPRSHTAGAAARIAQAELHGLTDRLRAGNGSGSQRETSLGSGTSRVVRLREAPRRARQRDRERDRTSCVPGRRLAAECGGAASLHRHSVETRARRT